MRDDSGRRGPAAGPAQASRPPQPGLGSTTRRHLWGRLRLSLWQRPHGEQPHERVVGPLELFYDLAVVVLVAQAARHLAGDLIWPPTGYAGRLMRTRWYLGGGGHSPPRSLSSELSRKQHR